MEEKQIIKNENYFIVQGWAINELKLKGNELLVYSIIYGFSQDGESKFKGSRKYMAEWLGVSLPTIDKTIMNLVEKNLIIKEQQIINGVTFNTYYANLEVVKNFYRGGKETLGGVVKNFYRGSQKTLHNNIEDNINNMNIIYIWENNEFCDCETSKNERCLRRSVYKINGVNYCNQHSKKILGDFFTKLNDEPKNKFIPPTIEEIEQFCLEKGYNINVKEFYDYYDVAYWKDSKGNKVKNWKQRVITWNSKNSNNNNQQPKPTRKIAEYAN